MKRKTNKSNENEVVKKGKRNRKRKGKKKKSRDENGKKKILKRTITDETGINQT